MEDDGRTTPTGYGPQGNAIRVHNYVHLVSDVDRPQCENSLLNRRALLMDLIFPRRSVD